MSDITLLPHNEVAYNELIDYLKDNQLVTMNRATGTGKSFILLKYMYENRNKRILFLSPTYPIIDQLIEDHMPDLGINVKDFSKFDTMIYTNFITEDVEEIAKNYDIIICDEYHRCGAKKTFRSINKLKNIILDKYPNTKFIGTTATEIRFLDNERNMMNELFEGHEVAKLSLADALLQGILPVPTYYNYDVDLIEDINKIKKRAAKMLFYEDLYKKVCLSINSINEMLEEVLKLQNEKEVVLPTNGKFLTFSSNIKNIEKDERKIDKFYPTKKVKYYVHSGRSNDANKAELRRFREADNSVVRMLYSIDILKEGVHVKNVDGIFMLRRTISPIIYFQQLGRVLSYSRRNDNVLVFDLVNNINHHKEIYSLYSDVIRRAKELLETDPANKERYLNILDKFKIIDRTSSMSLKVNAIKEQLKNTQLMEYRLDYATQILEGLKVNEYERIQAQLDIFKYKEYINIDLFKRIQKIQGINKPKIFNYTPDEFSNMLGDKRNIHEIQNANISLVLEKYVEFYNKYNKLPSIFSNDKIESNIALEFYNIYDKLNIEIKEKLLDYSPDNLTLIEKLSYEFDVDNMDIYKLIEEFKLLDSKTTVVHDNVMDILREQLSFDEIFKFKTKKLNPETDELIENDNGNYDSILFTENYQKYNKEISEAYNNNQMDEYINNYYKELIMFIDLYKTAPNYYSKRYLNYILFEKNDIVETNEYFSSDDINKKKNVKRITRDDGIIIYTADEIIDSHTIKKIYQEIKPFDQVGLYIKKIILNDELKKRGLLSNIEDKINEYTIKGISEKYDLIFNNILEYIKNNDGALPSLQNKDVEEKELAKQYFTYKNRFNEEQINLINETLNQYSINRKQIIKEYIDFIKNNKRKPSFANCPIEEIELNKKLNRIKILLTDEEKQMIDEANSSINKRAALKKAYEEMKAFKSKRQ